MMRVILLLSCWLRALEPLLEVKIKDFSSQINLENLWPHACRKNGETKIDKPYELNYLNYFNVEAMRSDDNLKLNSEINNIYSYSKHVSHDRTGSLIYLLLISFMP